MLFRSSDSHPDESVTDNRLHPPDDGQPQAIPQPVDLADRVKGMYRLLALIGESGSNGYGKTLLSCNNHWFMSYRHCS